MEMGGGGVKLDSHNLRDFLRIREEDHLTNVNQSGGGSRSSRAGVTLLAVLTDKRGPSPATDAPRRSVQSTRTLMDVLGEDQLGGRRDGRRSWRQLRDKIRLGRGSGWSSSVPFHAANNRRMVIMARRSGESSRSTIPTTVPDATASNFPANSSGERETERIFENATQLPGRRSLAEEMEEERSGSAATAPEPPAVRTSLMALLADNDWQLGYEDSPAYTVPDDEEEEEEEIVVTGGGDSGAEAVGGYNSCCICMIRHKGAAFIPCGHTFCRLCSRELWTQRGNCPLCNNYIVEILDIF